MIFFSIKSPYFLAWDNWLNILTAIAVIGIIAAPGTLLLTAGQFDLSVGSITAFTSVVIGQPGAQPQPGSPSSVGGRSPASRSASSTASWSRSIGVNALITTLGTLAAFRGPRGGHRQAADGRRRGLRHPRHVAAVPSTSRCRCSILVAVFVAFWALMRYTVYGRSMYAIGSNPAAARLVGIRSEPYIFIAFVLSGRVLRARRPDPHLAAQRRLAGSSGSGWSSR